MSTKATEKIIDALTQLMDGFAELQESLEQDYDPDLDDDDNKEGANKSTDDDSATNLEEALITEIKAAVEAVIENEDCAPEDLASIVSALTDALEDIDPEVFTHGEPAESSDKDEEDDDLDEDDEDDDDEDDDDEDDDDEDDDDEDEEDEDKDED